MFREISGPADRAAPRLLGALLVRELAGRRLVGRIVETEAYSQEDAASHSYRGRTPRTEIMFGPAGFLYVYFTYGMHYCMNIVCGMTGSGAAVLIRALEPQEGSFVANGPAKACRALGVDRSLNGHNLAGPPLQLVMQPPLAGGQIVRTTRVGITRAVEQPWRFYVAGSPFVSRK